MLLLYFSGTIANCEIRDYILLAVQRFPALAQAEIGDKYTIQSQWFLLLFATLFQHLFLTLQFLTALYFWGREDAPENQATYLSIYCKGGFRGLTWEMLPAGTGRYLTAHMMNCFINQISRFTSIFPTNSPFPLIILLLFKIQRAATQNMNYKPPNLSPNMSKKQLFSFFPCLSYPNITFFYKVVTVTSCWGR